MPEMTDAQAAACWKKLRGKIINVFANMEDDDELSCEWLLDEIYGLEFEQLHPAEPSKPAPDHGDPKDWKWNNAEPHCVTCAHDDTAECNDCHGRNKYEYADNRKPERRTCETCNNQFTQCWNGHIVCIDGSDWTPRKEE